MPANDTRRKVAELLGYHCALLSTRRGHPQIWVIYNPSGPEMLRNSASEDAAWEQLLNQEIDGQPVIPHADTDPAAAIGLLAGDRLEYEVRTVVRGLPDGTERRIIAVNCASAHVDPRRWGRAGAWVEGGDEAAAFAAAATDAWIAWRTGQGDE